MGWLFGCFKCRQRRRAGSSIDNLDDNKGGVQVSVTAGHLSATSTDKAASNLRDSNAHPQTVSSGTGGTATMQGSGLARTSSGLIKTERKHLSVRRHSSDQLSLVQKLEEEINDLNKKLIEEASQAKKLTNEVRHLRHCSELLDVPDAFRKALDALENAPEKVDLEESQPLLYLQSMLTRIETTEMTIDPSSAERADDITYERSKEGCIDLSSGGSTVLAPDHVTERNPGLDSVKEVSELKEGSEPSECQPLFGMVDVDATKPQVTSVPKRRRSSTTLSFSGFLVIESETEDVNASEQAASEHCSSTESSVTQINGTPDIGSKNLVEDPKSLFACTRTLQTHPISSEKPHSKISSTISSFTGSNSEVQPCFKCADVYGNLFKFRSPSCPQQDENTPVSCVPLSNFLCEHSQVDTSDHNYDGFSDLSSCISTAVTSGMDSKSSNAETNSPYACGISQLQRPLLEDKGSVKRYANSPINASESEEINNAVARNLWFEDFCSSVEVQAEGDSRTNYCTVEFCLQPFGSLDFSVSGSEAKHGFKSPRINSLERIVEGEATNLQGSHVAASEQVELSERDACMNKGTPCMNSPNTCTSLTQGEFCASMDDSNLELPTHGSGSVRSPSTDTSPNSICMLPPSLQANQDQNRLLSEYPSTPFSVNSCNSGVLSSKDDADLAHNTPVRTLLAPITQTETPNSADSQGSCTNSGEDRPILGTVAAHWNHASSSLKKTWWDGKGIPNSTNKYKEDQKVSWHATPFEVRLERALASQGRVFQKKLFTGPVAEMEVSI